jgi:ribosomal protein L6P/L9E
LGEKIIRKITVPEGVKITRKEELKDELTIEGNDLNAVSL